ncbi:hypothetical protein ACFY0P_09370 [Streptomyces sp. NPDC001714]
MPKRTTLVLATAPTTGLLTSLPPATATAPGRRPPATSTATASTTR